MEEMVNPYAAPEAIPTNLSVEESQATVSGKLIVVNKVAELPEYCYITGEKIIREKRRSKKLYYVNQGWILLLLLGIIGIIFYFVASACFKKSTIVGYHLSTEGRNSLRKKRIIGFLACFIIFCITIKLFTSGNQDLVGYGFLAVAAFLIALIVSISAGSAMRVKKYKNGQFYLTGSCRKFREILMQEQAGTRY